MSGRRRRPTQRRAPWTRCTTTSALSSGSTRVSPESDCRCFRATFIWLRLFWIHLLPGTSLCPNDCDVILPHHRRQGLRARHRLLHRPPRLNRQQHLPSPLLLPRPPPRLPPLHRLHHRLPRIHQSSSLHMPQSWIYTIAWVTSLSSTVYRLLFGQAQPVLGLDGNPPFGLWPQVRMVLRRP